MTTKMTALFAISTRLSVATSIPSVLKGELSEKRRSHVSLVFVAVAGTSIVAGRDDGEIAGRSDGKDFDLNSVYSKWSDYQDHAVVVRKNCGITHVANAVDADSILSSSPKGALGDSGKRNDFEVTSWFCEIKDGTVEVVSVVSETTQGASAVGVRVPGRNGRRKRSSSERSLSRYEEERRRYQGNTYHEGNGTKSNGVFQWMIERPRSSGEGGAAKVIGAGNVECLQKERSWNLSRWM